MQSHPTRINKPPIKFMSPPSSGRPAAKTEDSNENLDRILNLIIKISLHLLVFFLPLYFLPITVSPLESNKLTILVALTGIAGVAWAGRMVNANELRLKKSFLSVPILVFSAVYILSSLFSIYRENSLWGYLGGESLSLCALLFFVLLFYVISNNFSRKEEAYPLAANFLISGFIATTLGFLQLVGVNIFAFAGANSPAFNTVGSIFNLAAFAGALLLFSVALITEKVRGYFITAAATAAAVSSLLVVAAVNFKLVWLILALIMALLMTVGIVRNAKERSRLFLVPTVVFIICLFGFFAKKPIIAIQNLPTSISPSFSSTLSITKEGLKERFLFGSGPGNFSYLFAKYREPMGDLSSLNFSQGTSYLTTVFATGGLATILAYVFLLIIMGHYASLNVYRTFFGSTSFKPGEKQTDQGERMITPTSLFWLYLSIILILTSASFVLLFAWWLAFALLDALSTKGSAYKISEAKSRVSLLAEKIGMKGRNAVSQEKISKISLIVSLLFVGIITSFIAVVYIFSQKQIASYLYQSALTDASRPESNAEAVGQKLSRALYYNQNRDNYFSSLSDIYLYLANQRINEKKEDLNDEDRSYIWGAISQGIQAANSAVLVNPYNYNNYLKVASIYQGIIGLVNGADQPALENLERAQKLNPNNPYITNQIASIYLARYDTEIAKAAEEQKQLTELPDGAKENLKKAEQSLNRSLEIFPNDPTARLMKASIFELRGDLDQAIATVEETINLTGGNFNLITALALLYYKNQNYDQTLNILNPLVERWPEYSDARYILGLTYAQQRKLPEARAQFEKVQELNPDNPEIDRIVNDLRRGSTNFLLTTGEQKVEEVQQKVEETQRQEERAEQNILTGETPADENQTNGEETQPDAETTQPAETQTPANE